MRYFFMSMFFVLSCLKSYSYDFKEGDIYYNMLSSSEVEVTCYLQKDYLGKEWGTYEGQVAIPQSIERNGKSYKVVRIGEKAFYNCPNLTRVLIPNSVILIKDRAFEGCSGMTSIVVEIGNTVYDSRDNCNAIIFSADNMLIVGCQNTVIPNSVTSIGDRAFEGCSGLTSINIPNSVTSIGNRAFEGCSGLIFVSFHCKSINSWFSNNKSIKKITIGNEVTSIGSGAFYGCSGLTSVYIMDLAAWCKIQFCGSYSNPLEYAHHLYLNGQEIKDLVIPNSVTSIGSCAFADCSSLTSVTIPNSVTIIGEEAFANCSSLTSVTIPNSVPIIGEEAFANCSSLTSVTIPNSVTSIGRSAFYNCSGLTSVTIPNSVTSIGDWAFNNCTALTSVYIKDLEAWCKIQFCGSYSNPLEYAHHLYLNGQEIKDLVIPNSVTSIGDYSFADCSGLTSITIPNSVTSIGYNAFSGCSSLTSVTIPNSVTSIGGYAFSGCSSLTSITIPNSVTSIGNYAFSYCRVLSKIYSQIQNPFEIDLNVFSSVSTHAKLYVPLGTKLAYLSTIGWKDFGKDNIIEMNAPKTNYTLTLKSDGNGSISYNGTSVSSGSKSIEVTEGTNATVTITPNNGYRLSKLFVNNSDVTANVQNNQYTVQNVKNNTTVESSFEVIPPTKYTLTLSSNGNGSISYNGTSVSSGSKSIEVTEGTNATISVAPNNGYKLAKLMVNNSDVTASVENNQYTVSNIRSNITAEAFFELQSTGTGTSLDISAVCLGGAYTQSNDLINSGSQLNWSFRNNSNYSVVLKSLQLIDGKTGSEGNIMDVNENVGSNSSVSYAITIGALGIHVPVICRFRYDYDGYEYSTDAFYAGPRSNTICIKATGEGSVVYNNTFVNNQTSYFILESGKSVEISINPEQGYIIKSVKENGKDCSQNVIDNNYTINGINRDITLEVVFEKFDVSKSFGIRGINYKVVSQTDKTVSVVGVSNSLSGHVTIPESVSPDGHTWRVTQIVSGAFKNQKDLLTLKVPQSISSAGTGLFDGCTGLAAIMWDASVALTNEGVGNVNNPNLLVYVWNSGYAPSKIQNVVVNGTAQKIVLKDATSGNNFYCPSAFTAKAISYTHNYSMKSGKGESRGWETLALPFDVQTVNHASKGVLTPFALFKDANSERPFWLYEWTTGGWNAAQAIKANTPYIISMPNHDDYDDKYRLAGDVTFSAENAKVNATSSLQQNSYNGKTFVPCFGELAKGSGIYALNVENSVINNPINENPGSVFYNNLRGIHPFEGYMKSESNAAKFGVFDDGTITDIPSLPFAEKVPEVIKVYSLSGQLIRVMRNCSLDDATKGLQRGVYVVNGRRLVVDTQ